MPEELYKISQSQRSVNEVPEERRPRELFDRLGAGNVSEDVLLAILLRSGVKGHNVIDLSRGLLDHFGSLTKMAQSSVAEIASVKGMGPVKAQVLMAALELAKRLSKEELKETSDISSPENAAALVKEQARVLQEEVFWVLLLDTKNRPLRDPVEVTRGILNASLVHPREVFKEAIRHSAAAVILLHNHPSGECDPSMEDIKVTRQLIDAGQIMNIDVLDHIVVGKESENNSYYYSMREEGTLTF